MSGPHLSADQLSRDSVTTECPMSYESILDQIPDGVVILNSANRIVWSNQQFQRWSIEENLIGLNFYQALDLSILGPEFHPFSTVLESDRPCTTKIRIGDDLYCSMDVRKLCPPSNGDAQAAAYDSEDAVLIATLRDTTSETLERQTLDAIHRAGTELADLEPEELLEIGYEERVEILKQDILHICQEVLKFDSVEIRVLDPAEGVLIPLLSVGIDSEEAKRPIFPCAKGNGVTGLVAATGRSYLCLDTANDPAYVDGMVGALCSLTVPLKYHDTVIGTINVESAENDSFAERELQFVELFARDIALALNKLQLLDVQSASASARSVYAAYAAVGPPVDKILDEAVHVMFKNEGGDTEIDDRLRKVMDHAREIKNEIHRIGKECGMNTILPKRDLEQHPWLNGKRILVIDAEEETRKSAHEILEPYGCIVETAQDGQSALKLVENCRRQRFYSVILADIRLPDFSGYEILMKLKESIPDPPLALMTGFGWDPGHSIVKARKAGLRPDAILYKPFKIHLLLPTLERIISESEPE
jgi:two-component system, sensor histidine kinase SagS